MEVLEGVKLWVRNIAVVILAAGFLEIVLPRGDMQRFARLVVGFFVLLAIVQPLIGLFHQQAALNTTLLETTAAGTPDTAAVLAKGRELQANHTRAAVAEYRAAVERQVAAVAVMVGARARSVAVDLDTEPSSSTFGALRSIQVVITEPTTADGATSAIVPIDPVKIDFDGEDTAAPDTSAASAATGPPVPAELCARVAEALANYYGLTSGAVSVTAGE